MRKTKTHNVLRRLLAFVLIVSLLPLGYAGNVMAATTGTRNVSIQVTYGQTDARNVYGMINSMRRNSSDAWYWDANNYTKTYCNNLQPLTYDYALEQVAMKRAAEIALSYSHTRPNGTNYYTAYSENGVYAGVFLDIKQMKDGTLWICTNMGGVSILNLRENTFISPEKITFSNITVTNDNHGLSGPNARSIIQDSFGNIWIGNYRGGVDFISYAQPLFNTIAYTIEKQGKINNKQVWGLWADNHQIWLGGEGELGIYEKGKKTKNFSLHECRLHPQTHINVIYQDKQERLWLGTYKNGILLYTPKDGRITRINGL